MKFNKSLKVILEIVTYLTQLRVIGCQSLTQNNIKLALQKQQRPENSITLNAKYYDNTQYPSYGKEIDYTNGKNKIRTSYQDNYSKYSSSKHVFKNYEQYPNTERQQDNKREEEVLVDNANNIQQIPDQINSSTMETNTLVVLVVVILILIVLIAVGCGIFMICKKDNPEAGPGYSVAISNRLFKESTDGGDLPCLNCRLIEMGEMACYTERCPQCGNIPPCRKELYPEQRQAQRIKPQQQRQQEFSQKPNQQQLQNTSSTIVTYSAGGSRNNVKSNMRSPRHDDGMMSRDGYYMRQNSEMV